MNLIIRTIDDLGRVSIPKEIRRKLRLRAGDALECSVSPNDEVVFKKYSVMGNINNSALQLCEAMHAVCGVIAVVTDRDSIVAAPIADQDLIGKRIGTDIANVMSSYHHYLGNDSLYVLDNGSESYRTSIVVLIFNKGCVTGSVVILENENYQGDNNTECRVAKTIASLLEKEIDI